VNRLRCLVALVILGARRVRTLGGRIGTAAPYQQEDPRDTSGMH
jgi:hypothetical protein